MKLFRFGLALSPLVGHQQQVRFHCYRASQLVNKKLIAVNGEHCYRYLQGLITNDMRNVYPHGLSRVQSPCMYSFLLHPNGRVFVDLFVYNLNHSGQTSGRSLEAKRVTEEPEHEEEDTLDGVPEDQLMIEVDGSISDKLVRHLRLHKLRSKVTLSYPDDRYRAWSLYPNGKTTDPNKFPELDEIHTEECILTVDPRFKGHYKCLIHASCDIKVILSQLGKRYNFPFSESPLEDYERYRWESGISEGAADHPDGNCFPLECNGDLLQAISFSKGCYIGQELTARIYHTGVVRKRYLPIRLITHRNGNISRQDLSTYPDCDITSDPTNGSGGTKLGKLRIGKGDIGLGLMYMERTIISGQLEGYLKRKNDDEVPVKVETYKPFWWPDQVKLINK